MSNTLTVALLQLARVEGEMAAGEAVCRRAKALGADIALFPEMWSNGYLADLPPGPGAEDVHRHPDLWGGGGSAAPSLDGSVWRGKPVARDSAFVGHFRELAAELDLAIALTYLEKWDGPEGPGGPERAGEPGRLAGTDRAGGPGEPGGSERSGRLPPRNTVSLIDRHGRLALTYAKAHTCAFALPEAALTPGDSFEVRTLDTAAGPVEVGAMICYDREFPESARALMLAGAELILTPNACELEQNRLAQLRSRAYENMTAIAVANYAGPGWGRSVAFDGMAFDEGGTSRDMLVVEAGEAPGIYPAVFDLDALRAYRRRETWGDAFRRPSTYGALTDRTVREPFTRVDAEGHRLPC
ncbi:carbon-nitrogen hydrolase family protein [Streptomyces pathocidini]|uniref:Carbon-nitrogen hydrolase family protein n=1 Tax=Streptomyces pathocidini TaxID=1650571 RepID=A0ABW7UK92_9ACTN